jgi:hypothetical protein
MDTPLAPGPTAPPPLTVGMQLVLRYEAEARRNPVGLAAAIDGALSTQVAVLDRIATDVGRLDEARALAKAALPPPGDALPPVEQLEQLLVHRIAEAHYRLGLRPAPVPPPNLFGPEGEWLGG